VHRDFKPENVLVGRDGQVRVGDFGLVRGAVSDAAEAGGAEVIDAAPAALTRSGVLLGTPAYMAPEQWRGGPVDARTDQFAFCVALYEALHGARPYEPAALAAAHDEPPPPPKLAAGRAPARVLAALGRGLALAPDQRFPSMDALLAALAGSTTKRRRWAGVAAGAALLLAASAALGARGKAGPVCAGAEARLAGAWDEARRAEVRAAFRASNLPYAEASLGATEAALDRYARGITSMHTDACEATHVRGEQSGALLDLRMACLGRRRDALRALVDVLARAEGKVVESSIEAVNRLPPLDECASVEALTAPVPLPADAAARARIEAARARLAEGDAKRAAGRYDESRAVAEGVLAEAKALGYRPLEAEAEYAFARAEALSDRVEPALAAYQRALAAAQAGKHDAIAAEASIAMVRTAGYRLRRHDEGRRWASLAEGAVERLGSPPRLVADRLKALADVAEDEGRAAESLGLYERALEIDERLYGPDDLAVAQMLRALAHTLLAQERNADAARAAERCLAITEQRLGPDHPELSRALYTLGFVRHVEEKYDEARALLQRAVAIKERAFGPDHPTLMLPVLGLARVETVMGKHQEALANFERALAIQERAAGRDDPEAIDILVETAGLLGRMGRHERRLEVARRALAIGQKTLAPDNVDLAPLHYQLGLTYQEMGKPAEALPHLEKALAIADTHPLTDSLSVGRHQRGRMILILALALWDSGRDRPRARALMARALEIRKSQGESGKHDVEEIERWLAEHRL
jgi:tetratricopeptide (TPR) repeat protein